MASISELIKEYEIKIDNLKTTIANYQSDIIKFENTIEVLREHPEANVISNEKTLNEKCIEILKDVQHPMSSRDLMNEINHRYRDKKYEFAHWSAAFSQMHSKPNSGITKYIFDNQPAKTSTYYGLSEWFKNEELEDIHIRRIKEIYDID